MSAVVGLGSAGAAMALPDALAVPERLCHSDECLSLPLRSFRRGGAQVVLEQTFGRGRGGGGSSTGAAVWEGSLLMSRLLERGGAPGVEVGPSTRVLELGSGCGLGAVAAAKLGAGSVVATDGNARVLALLQSNLERNGLGPPQVRTAQLQWGLDVGPDRPREASDPGPPDLVLGADLTYYPGTVPALAATLRDLDAPSIVLVHHVRQASDEAALAQLYLPGYDVHVLQLSDPDGSDENFQAVPVADAATVPPGGFYALVMTKT